MTDSVPTSGAAPAWHTLSVTDALAAQGVTAERGLSAAQVTERRAKSGPNRFTEQETESRWHAFLRQYADAMQIVLLVGRRALTIIVVRQVPTGVMLILLTVFNAYLGLSQEGKAAAAVAALQKMMVVKARVRRDGELRRGSRRGAGAGRHRRVRGRATSSPPTAASSRRPRSRSTRRR